MFDTHCHLDDPRFDGDRAEVLARAAAAGVRGIMIPGIRPRTWAALAAVEHAAPAVAVAFGVHPQVVPELDAAERAVTHRLTDALAAARTPHTAAVGECGLDGGTGERAEQERILRAHVRAARELRLPLVVHVLRAHDAAPRILREERAGDVGGVLHSYSGGPELVPVYRDLGFAFSFAGPVTWPGAKKPLAAARAVPAELLLAETDAPDQSPAPFRGQRSEPARIAEVVRGLAAARGSPFDAIAALTSANARRVFSRAWPSPGPPPAGDAC